MVKNANDYEIYHVTDHAHADALLDILHGAMLSYAQNAGLPLYRSDGSYYLEALNWTRGDLMQAMDERVLLAVWSKAELNWVALLLLSLDPRGDSAFLSHFSVARSQDIQNVGKILLQGAYDYLRQEAYRNLFLQTSPQNKAVYQFYQEQGFKLYDIDNSGPYFRVYMLKDLSRGDR